MKVNPMVFIVIWYQLVDYAATEMGFLDDYSDAAPQCKSMRGNDITTFLLHVAQCTIFNIKNRYNPFEK